MEMTQEADILAAAAEIVGLEHAIAGREAGVLCGDALGSGRFPRLAEPSSGALVVARPAGAAETAALVRLAGERRIAVVPHGGGSGLMGGALPVVPSLVIDSGRMNRVIHVSRDDQSVRAEAGAVLGDVNREIEPHGLVLGHDPWTLNVATIGGTISTDSLGYLGAKYGSMGDQVLSLEVVLPDGTLLETGAPAKASIGPDLCRLFIAGEGCFGVITASTLRAYPIPEERAMLAFAFDSFADGFAAVLAMRAVGLAPDVLELGESWGWDDGEPETPTLYIGFEGYRGHVRAGVERAAVMCEKAGGRRLDEGEAWAYWEHRHDIGDRFAQRRKSGQTLQPQPGGGGFDYAHVAIRASDVLEYRERCLELLRERHLSPVEIGIWCRPELLSVYIADRDGSAGPQGLTAAVDDILRLAQERGAAMEYCHGVGVRLAHLMAAERRGGLDVLRGIKRALDPQNIMNPGKLGL